MRLPDTTLWTAPPPDGVAQCTVQVVGNPSGTATYFYWLVAHFPIGSVISGPFAVRRAPKPTSLQNYILLSWQAPIGATAYDLLRTSEPRLPAEGSPAALALHLAVTTFKDQGQVPAPYSLAGLTYGAPINGMARVNNRDYSEPVLDLSPTVRVTKLLFPDGSEQTSGGGGGGVPGPPGPQGVPGVQGVAGPPGQQGPTGVAGPTGVQGPPGSTGPAGPQGSTGPTGATGSTGPQGSTGSPGATGAQGPPGPAGPAGSGVTIKGSVATSADLPTTGNTVGDAWITQDTGHLWVWSGTAWDDAGNIIGPPGPTGPQGPTGATGATGPPGSTGATGATGPQGATGATGPPGPAIPATSTTLGSVIIGANVNVLANGTISTPMASVFGRTGAVTAQAGDYTVAQVTGALADPTTTLGDLIVRGSSAIARLPVGANGQVLIADSTQTLGVKWGAVVVAAAGADKQIQYNKAGALAADGNLYWDYTAQALNVQAGITVSSSTGNPQITILGAGRNATLTITANAANTLINLLSNGGFQNQINSNVYSGSTGTQGLTIITASSRGTQAVPSPTQAADIFLSWSFQGQTPNGFFIGAGITVASEAAWTASATPAYIAFQTAPAGSSSFERLRINSAGRVLIGGPADDGSSILQVSQPNLVANLVSNAGVAGSSCILKTTNYSGTGQSLGGVFSGYSSRGTLASPAPLMLNDWLATFQGFGWDGTQFQPASAIRMLSDGTFAANAPFGNITFFTSNGATQAERMRITGAGNVGIGTFQPSGGLDVGGHIRSSGANPPTVGSGVEIGFLSSQGYIAAYNRSGSGPSANLILNVTGNPIHLNAAGSTAVGFVLVGQVNPDSTGCMLQVTTGISNNGAVVAAVSDIRLKRDVEPFREGLAAVLRVDPIRFKYNGKGGTADGFPWVSIDAQAHADIIPDAINTYEGELDGETTTLYNFSTQPLLFALVNAVKELSTRIKQLETK